MFQVLDDSTYRGNIKIDNVKHLREVLDCVLKDKQHEDVLRKIVTENKYNTTVLFINTEYTKVAISGYGFYMLLKEQVEMLFGQYDRNSPLCTNKYDETYLLARKWLAEAEGQTTLVNAIELMLKYKLACNHVIANKTYNHDYKSLIIESIVLANLNETFDIRYLLYHMERLKTQNVFETAVYLLSKSNIIDPENAVTVGGGEYPFPIYTSLKSCESIPKLKGLQADS